MLMNNEFNTAELRRIDLNLLVVFAALMKSGSARAAAAALFLTPPAVSMALGRLRDLFDDPLFVRSRGGLEPTSRAHALMSQLAPALGEIERAVLARPEFDPATAVRTIRFACPDDLEPFLLPRLLARLAAEAPGLRVIGRAADFRSVPDALDAGDADVALTAKPGRLERRHRHKVLCSERFAVVYRKGLFGRRRLRTMDQYLAHPHVLLSVSGDLEGTIDLRLRQLGHRRRIGLSLVRFATFPFVLESVDAVGNMPGTAAYHYASRFGLVADELPFESPTFDLVLVWHVRSDEDAALVWFRSLLEELVGALRVEAERGRR